MTWLPHNTYLNISDYVENREKQPQKDYIFKDAAENSCE